MASERFKHTVGGEGSDHASASESGELAGPTDPNEHAGAEATAVGGRGAAGNVGGQGRHRQPQPRLYGAGPCGPATTAPDLCEAVDAAATNPTRAMGRGAAAAPALATAFSIDKVAE